MVLIDTYSPSSAVYIYICVCLQSIVVAAVGTNVEASMNTYIGPKYIMFGIPEPTATGAVSTSEDAAAYLWKESVRITEHDIEELLLV